MEIPLSASAAPARSRSLTSYLFLGGLVAALAAGTYIFWVHDYLVADSWTVIDAVSKPGFGPADLLPFRENPLRTSATYYYAPVLAALVWLAYRLGGYSPERYNLILMILHMGTTLFLFSTVLQLTGSRLKATSAGAVFAVHFGATEAVGWFGAVTHPTAGFFGAMALALYSRFLVTRRRGWMVGALAALVAAALTQSTGLPWFAVLGSLDFLYSWKREGFRKIGRRLAILAILLAAILPLQFQAFRFAQGGYHYTLGPWAVLNLFYYPLSTVLPSLEQSAYSLARDLPLAFVDHSAFVRLVSMNDAFGLLLASGLIAVAVLVIWAKGGRLCRFALIAFGLSMTPFLFLDGQGYRYLYTPLIFFSMAAASALVDLYSYLRLSSRTAALAIIAIIPLFVVLSFAESQRQLFWWNQAGLVAQNSLTQLKRLDPSFPPGAKLVFGGLPDTIPNTNAEVWRQGITEAVRVVYGDRTLRVEAFSKGTVEQLFRGDLKGAPNTYGFVWENWQLKQIAP